jgi:hypothetical protein
VGAVVALITVGCFSPLARAAPLPDGRAYERVSPVDKNGGDITGDGQMVVASASGNAISYASRASFADTLGTGGAGQTQYIARRGSGGWATQAITPRPAPEAFQIFTGGTQIPIFSDELASAILWAYDLPDVSGDSPSVVNLYREDTATRTIVPLDTSQASPLMPGEFSGAFWGASDDARHVSLVFQRPLLPGAPAGVPTVYEWADGALRIAGVMPDGTVPDAGSDVLPKIYRRTVSPDGSRVMFVSPPTGDSQLYMRVDGERTVWVSGPESSGFVGEPADVMLQAVSGDGRHVLFTTSSPLLREDDNGGSDLYLYTDSSDPTSDSNLTLISRSGASSGGISGADDGGAVVGTSDDASRIYFDDTNGNLYLWDHGDLKHLSSDVPRGYDRRDGALLAVTDSMPGASRVTPDGRHLAFLTNATSGSDQVHGLTGQVTNAHLAMYAYDAATGALNCCSCPSDGRPATADAQVVPNVSVATASSRLSGARPRYLSSDGEVFFSTADALVPEDTNLITDTYECDARTGTVSLLSSGRSADGAWFVDASATGGDVFLVTRTRLVGTDRDALVDLYDARVGGGFPEPGSPPRACVGEECQGDVSGTSNELGIGTESFSGAGSAPTPRRAHVKLIGARLFVGASARVAIRVSDGGKLSWRGVGIRPGARRVSHAGTYRVRISLTPRARTQFRQTGVQHSLLTLRFTTLQHSRSAATVGLTFKTNRVGKAVSR